MALVAVARFTDFWEGQVALSALRAAGLNGHLQNENWGSIDFSMRWAMGGFPLWVPEQEAEEANAILGEAAEVPPEPAPERSGFFISAAAIMMEMGLGEGGGWLLPAARRQRLTIWWDVLLGWALSLGIFLAGCAALLTIGKLLTDPP